MTGTTRTPCMHAHAGRQGRKKVEPTTTTTIFLHFYTYNLSLFLFPVLSVAIVVAMMSSPSCSFLRGTGATTTAMLRSLFLLVLLSSASVITAKERPPVTNKSTSRAIKIMNHSGSRLEVYWIHPQTREGTLMSSPIVMNGADFPLNSYVGHEFEIRELPSKKTGECISEDQTCRSTYFTVSENDDQREYK
jgi:hypothetical protein